MFRLTAKLIIITLFFSDLSKAQIINNQIILDNLKNEMNIHNKAIVEIDSKSLYETSFEKYTGSDEEEKFKKGNSLLKTILSNTNMKIVKIVVKEIGPIVFCESEYQCLIKRETVVSRDNNEYSASGIFICLSKDGTDWYFLNLMDKDFETVKSFYPKLCPEVNFIK